MPNVASSRFAPFAVVAALLLLAAVLAVGAAALPADKGYTIVGTHVFPLVVASLIGLIGVGLAWEARQGRLRPVGVDGTSAAGYVLDASRWRAAACVSIGLLLDALLIERVGFVLAATMLFALAARGFGSRRWGRNFGIGLMISWPVYLLFTLGLNISLPGAFKPWI